MRPNAILHGIEGVGAHCNAPLRPMYEMPQSNSQIEQFGKSAKNQHDDKH
jgi:hypothetical protein